MEVPLEQAEAFLQDQISLAQRSLIPVTMKTAYEAADILIKETAILNTPSAKYNRGRIIQHSVEAAFERLVQSGQWPFDYRWSIFKRPTGKYLEILPSHCSVTISQVADHRRQPRNVCFRANKRASGQMWLTGLSNPEDDQVDTGIPHVLLLHGHQEPNFAYLAMPNADHGKGFYYKSGNLMLMPHAISTPEYPVEQTDIEAVMTLKEQIDKRRKDNDG